MAHPTRLLVSRIAGFSVLLALLLYTNLSWHSEQVGKLSQSGRIQEVVDRVIDEAASNLVTSPDLYRRKSPRIDLGRIATLQSSLSCSVHEGTWENSEVRVISGSQTPLHFKPSQTCFHPAEPRTKNPSVSICPLVGGKRILFVGPETTYYLHSLWLSSLENHENRSHVCLGEEYCSFHHICRPPATNAEDELDLFVGRKKKIPNRRSMLSTNSSVLQYALSTTLHSSQNRDDGAYTRPTVDSDTGVRMHNTYWLRRARKADVVVMNRGPLPAPAWTYDNRNPQGNWSFLASLWNENRVAHLDTGSLDNTLNNRLVNAALWATLDLFIPSLVRSLRVILEDKEIQEGLLVWHGSWYLQPVCTHMRIPKGVVPSLQGFWYASDGVVMSPWDFYYNAQGMVVLRSASHSLLSSRAVYMHDRLLPQLLPHFNITFLPLTVPRCTKCEHSHIQSEFNPFRSRYKDCIRHPWSSYGKDGVEVAFFNALMKLIS
ncbi:hypothetical protein B0H34DRAFT_698436 [Crassisporium funariophilum]|nr:hypothetical protein B0H34DRAFT_698436 [Crassisporium funariophilum]